MGTESGTRGGRRKKGPKRGGRGKNRGNVPKWRKRQQAGGRRFMGQGRGRQGRNGGTLGPFHEITIAPAVHNIIEQVQKFESVEPPVVIKDEQGLEVRNNVAHVNERGRGNRLARVDLPFRGVGPKNNVDMRHIDINTNTADTGDVVSGGGGGGGGRWQDKHQGLGSATTPSPMSGDRRGSRRNWRRRNGEQGQTQQQLGPIELMTPVEIPKIPSINSVQNGDGHSLQTSSSNVVQKPIVSPGVMPHGDQKPTPPSEQKKPLSWADIDHSDPNHTHPEVGDVQHIAGFGMIDWSASQGP